MSDDSKHRPTANDIRCWDCAADPTARLEEMFVELIQRTRIERGQRPARRTVFLKQHGVAYGFFRPVDGLPKDLAIGTFGLGQLPCWVRLSSDTQPTSPDLHTTLGLAIKLFGVPGCLMDDGAETADFIFQNHDVFFVDDAKTFCEFTTAGVVDGDYPAYLRRHPKTAKILDEMQKAESSCLTAHYWSILPFALGTHADGTPRYAKYRLVPMDQPAGEPFDDKNYLGLDLARRLRQGRAVFRFEVQLRTDPETMPLDEATVRWDSPWMHVADLVLAKQDIEARGQADYGRNLAFNIWRTPPEQEPQGSIAAARRVVYQGSADQRRRANGVTTTEPKEPPPQSEPVEGGDCIVKAAIYPPIGICRVGNSPEAFYIGPEVPEPLPKEPGAYRDAKGRLKREAARFRVYGLNALGKPVKELTADDATIEWRVELANVKSDWYEFQLALDIPEAADVSPSLRRNGTVSDRASLRIEPGPKTIKGKGESGAQYAFDKGCFMGTQVYLGELRTDDAGRLIVLGGHGRSASYDGSPAITFANNDGWHDDTSDGPVTAKVTYNGVELRVDPAWVVCAPPNYGPQQKSVRTMWDLMRDLAIAGGTVARPSRPSFEHDIRPIFERMSNLQWVNQGFFAGFGFRGPFDFSSPDWMARLADPTPANLEMRRVLMNNFRDFATDAWSPVPWPWLYGDAMTIPAAKTPRQHAALSGFQMWCLERWVEGDFDADYDPNRTPPRAVEDVPVAEQPDLLTRAAMEFCLADAFHPGCEMTWPMRQSGMYESPFRLAHRKHPEPRAGYGAQLGDSWSLPDGPINGGQSPGSVTRWMAVPWQTDTASCRSGYDTSYDPYVPTFWPARVPNEVLSKEAYAIVMNDQAPRSERLQAFANRANWLAPLGLAKSYTHQINHMIHHFDEMGVVEVRPGPTDGLEVPATLQVSDQAQPQKWKLDNVESSGEGPPSDLRSIEKVRRFPNGFSRSRDT